MLKESPDAAKNAFLSAIGIEIVRRRKRRSATHRFCHLKQKQGRLIRASEHRPGPNDAQGGLYHDSKATI